MVFGRIGLYSNGSTEWNICGPDLKIRVYGDSKIGVCNTYIEMYEDMYVNNVFPISSPGIYLGGAGPTRGFEGLYLRDQSTGSPRKLSVSAGVLVIT
jgi:hypothetical protein